MRALLALAMIAAGVPALLTGGAVAETSLSATHIPSTDTGKPKQFWRQFMVELYGPYDRKKKCWISKSGSTRYCMRPHTLDTVSTANGPRYYVSVGGTSFDAAGNSNECHGCGGALDLFVLRKDGEHLGIVARNAPYMEFGSWGSVPTEDQFHLQKIGAGDNFAWVIESGFTGQGITISHASVFSAIGDKITQIGALPLSYDDDGNCGPSSTADEKCSNYSFNISFDTSSAEKFVPVRLVGSGVYKDAPFSRTYVVKFNRDRLKYIVPADIPSDFAD